jgi:hypothetical protein
MRNKNTNIKVKARMKHGSLVQVLVKPTPNDKRHE